MKRSQGVSFHIWFGELEKVARKHYGNCADAEAWEDPFNRDLTPQEAWYEEWPDDECDDDPAGY